MRVTQRKLEANRRNGARSKGPVSDAGKMGSAANSITHGLSVLDMEIDILQPEIEHTFQSMDAEGLWALGFKSLSDHSHVLVNLDRQQTRLFRQYHRVARHLAEAQASRRMDHINEPTAPHAIPGEEPSCQAA
ncbi:MAG: hypothetical protein SFV51_14940 [Bryobacteraceae bacterium]|nr:hypothetical protein [Bryobacteraceae bacterium]